MSVKTLPDQITDLLISLVFIGRLEPGDKLPPERKLAEYLAVDRTSLRMALRTLTRMNVVHTLQGSGIRVLDYKVYGGLDFLSSLYQIDELELGGEFLLSGLEVFNRTVPAVIKIVVEKNSAEAQGKILELVHKMYHGIQNGKNHHELAMLDVELVDALLASSNNVFMQISGSNTRKIRQALTEKMYELIDVKAHLDFLISMMMRIASGIVDLDEIMQQYAEHIDKVSQPLKDFLLTLPPTPSLILSPLNNGKNIIDFDDIMKKNSAVTRENSSAERLVDVE